MIIFFAASCCPYCTVDDDVWRAFLLMYPSNKDCCCWSILFKVCLQCRYAIRRRKRLSIIWRRAKLMDFHIWTGGFPICSRMVWHWAAITPRSNTRVNEPKENMAILLFHLILVYYSYCWSDQPQALGFLFIQVCFFGWWLSVCTLLETEERHVLYQYWHKSHLLYSCTSIFFRGLYNALSVLFLHRKIRQIEIWIF